MGVEIVAGASPLTAVLSCAAESELIASVIAVSTSGSASVTVGANVGGNVSFGPRRVMFRRKRGSINVGEKVGATSARTSRC